VDRFLNYTVSARVHYSLAVRPSVNALYGIHILIAYR